MSPTGKVIVEYHIELAKQASESNNERWKHKLAMERAGSDLKDKMCQFFGNPGK